MTIVFVGPTLGGEDLEALAPGVVFRGPARQGDIAMAVAEGARAIGLIDGVYEHVPAVWHKEILFALSRGIAVYGAASMGALRAAECAAFGMIGIGEIFAAYHRGVLIDDADVAQLHAPRELGYAALSEPLVNVRATLARLAGEGAIDEAEARQLDASAARLFFKDRSWRAIVDGLATEPARRLAILGLVKSRAIDVKRRDALLLLARIVDPADAATLRTSHWSFARTQSWDRNFGTL